MHYSQRESTHFGLKVSVVYGCYYILSPKIFMNFELKIRNDFRTISSLYVANCSNIYIYIYIYIGIFIPIYIYIG